MEDCIFCKIIKGEIPCSKLYEDDSVLAFLDINPANPGHTLVVPKAHSKNLLETTDSDLDKCSQVIKRITPAIMKAVDADGCNIGVNTNKAAGQVVMHTHIHIIPRFEGDGFKMWEPKKYDEGELETVHEKITRELAS